MSPLVGVVKVSAHYDMRALLKLRRVTIMIGLQCHCKFAEVSYLVCSTGRTAKMQGAMQTRCGASTIKAQAAAPSFVPFVPARISTVKVS